MVQRRGPGAKTDLDPKALVCAPERTGARHARTVCTCSTCIVIARVSECLAHARASKYMQARALQRDLCNTRARANARVQCDTRAALADKLR
eukprot:3358071-Alexandrium_andersonii.AAC.1